MLSRFPYPLEKGDKLRAYYQLKELSNYFNITLICTTDTKIDRASIEKIKPYCSSIHIFKLGYISIFINLIFQFFTKKPFQIGYFYSSKNAFKINEILKDVKPDHIFCQLIRVAEYVKNYHDCPKTLDYMDALSKGMDRRIENAPFYKRWIIKEEAERLSRYETKIFDYFENHIMISEQDIKYIIHPDKKKIKCIPNGVDEIFFEQLNTKKEYDLVFVGNLSYQPNIEAINYIFKTIIPSNKNKQLSVLVSGATPHNSVKKIITDFPDSKLTGWVDDIRESYQKGKIFVAPMFIGTGLQNKLIEAMAMGIPCITTSLANNALNAIHLEQIMVANTKEEFIQSIEILLSNPELYNKIAKNAKKFVQENYNWQNTTFQIVELINQQKNA